MSETNTLATLLAGPASEDRRRARTGIGWSQKPTQKPSKTGTQFSDKMPKMQFETCRRERRKDNGEGGGVCGGAAECKIPHSNRTVVLAKNDCKCPTI